ALALGLGRLLGPPLGRAAHALGPRLGAANPLGRWRAAAIAALALTATGLAIAWPRSPQLRAVFVVPWWMALALIALGCGFGLAHRAQGRRWLRPRGALVLALAMTTLFLVTVLWWGGEVRTKYVAVTASPAFNRLIALVRVMTDLDRDGYGSLLGENDCAPLDPAVRPFAVDVPDNGRDENCDGHDFSMRDVPAATGPRPGVPPAFQRPWNILLLTIDTVRYDRTSFGGYRDGPRRRDTTPRLAELVNKSVSFSHAMAPAAGTMASIPALMTSKFFHSGIALQEDVAPRSPPRVAPENLLLPEVMKQGGYRTGVIASHDYWNDWGLDQGVDDYDNTIGAKPNPFLIAADKVTDRALAWISRQGEARWFLWAHYIDPHGRYVAHP
ncbi:MAG TPA: sulfatase-like hydrolase/transferase, partial [Kofleriaceae bacterium]|nr:sulfatase-like hydrolase/transferase [Kofleriaceae bacterium]